MEFATQAVVAAQCMEDDEAGRQSAEANGVAAVIECSDLSAPDFDEALMHRYAFLSDALKDEADSIHHVLLQEVWVRRHVAMGRTRECADACREILALAATPRFAQLLTVQHISVRAAAKLLTLGEAGAIARDGE